MKTQDNNNSKNTSFKLSEQVKRILHSKGLSKVFNYTDYKHFKRSAKNAFNVPNAIAQMFVEEHRNESDLTDYQF